MIPKKIQKLYENYIKFKNILDHFDIINTMISYLT